MLRVSAVVGLAVLLGSSAAWSQSSPSKKSPRVAPAYQNLPLQFEPNLGQAPGSVQYFSHGQGYNLLLDSTSAVFELHHTAPHAKLTGALPAERTNTVRMRLLGSDAHAPMSAERPLTSYVNYMSGKDASKFKTGIPTAAATRVKQVYPGIDLVYYGAQRQLEYDFVVAPNASPASIAFAMVGAKPRLNKDGELVLQLGAKAAETDLRFHKPVLYQEANGKREPVEGAFTLAQNGTVGFQVGPYDHARALTIDPIISYASYFGGTGEDEINGSTINSANQLYAVGQTYSAALPGTAGEFMTAKPTAGSHSAFVTKFSADGSTILWTTYLAGSQDDLATSVAVNGSDQAYVVGYTNSCGASNAIPGVAANTAVQFPFTSDRVQNLCSPNTNGYGPPEINGGSYDVFLVKLSSDGKSLLYSTPIGGSNNDIADSVVLDAAGKVYIVGETTSTMYLYAVASNQADVPSYPVNNHGVASTGISNYPTTSNAFYSNTTESRQYATLDGSGNSVGPTDEQAFLTVLSADLHTITYSSLIGGGVIGGCGNGACNTNGIAIAVNSNGIAFIGGNTSSAHWPVTANAIQSTCGNSGASGAQCNLSGWAAGFNPSLSGSASLLFSTYIGGNVAGLSQGGATLYPFSDVFGMTTDSLGNVIMTGDTNADNLKTTSGTYQPACTQGTSNGNTGLCNQDSYLTKLSPTGAMVWSTYLNSTTGSYAQLIGEGVAVDASNNVYLLAQGGAPGVPLINAINSNPGQNQDAYLAEFAPDASKLVFATYLGSGAGITVNSNSLHLDSNANAYFSGYQGVNPYGGTYFPITANAADKTIQGNDGFVVKMITQQQPSATALTASPTGTATSSQTVTLTAAVTSASTLTGIPNPPSGTVTFMNGTAVLGTAQTLTAAGVATFAGTFPNGTYSFTAVYSGDAGFNASTSTAAPLTVSSAVATVTGAGVTPASAALGQSVNLNSTTAANGAGVTSGTVTYTAGGVTLGTATVNASGVASVNVTPAAGTYSVIASYAGTVSQTNPTGYASSVSAPVTLVVAKGTATAGFTATPALSPTGSAVALKATIATSVTSQTPSGTVTFFDGTTAIGTATIAGGVASFSTTSLAAGTHVLSASYAGDANFGTAASSTVTVTVRASAATTTMLAVSGTAINKGGSETLTATIASTVTTGSPTGTVTFLDGTTTLGTGTVSGNVATFTTTALAAGSHSLTAMYGGDTLFSASVSTPMTVVVTAPSLSFTIAPNPLVIKAGNTGTATITGTPIGGFLGSVSFACVGLPQYVTCSFNPSTLTFVAGSSAMTSTLTVATTQQRSAITMPGFGTLGGGVSFAMLGLLWLGRRRRLTAGMKRLLMVWLVMAGLGGAAMLSGCGSTQQFGTATPGSYSVTVTTSASDGSSQTLPLTVTVQ